MARECILYVDDETQALKYFNLSVTILGWEVLTASSYTEAWQIIEREGERIALVISDQRMPGKSGVELLAAVRERQPATMRLLVTAYSDLNSAIDAVNKGAIYAYVTKPTKPEEMRQVLQHAIAHRNLERERDALLGEKLSVIQHLLLSDRLRSLGVMASAFTGAVNRPLAAITAFARDRVGHYANARDGHADPRDFWPTVMAQTQALLNQGRDLGTWLHAPRAAAASCDVGALITNAVKSVPGFSAGPLASTLTVDAALLTTGFQACFRALRGFAAAQQHGCTGTVTLSQPNGGGLLATIQLDLSGTPDAVEAGADLSGLQAYLAIYHHGGEIAVQAWSATTATITVQLPAAGSTLGDDSAGFLASLDRSER